MNTYSDHHNGNAFIKPCCRKEDLITDAILLSKEDTGDRKGFLSDGRNKEIANPSSPKEDNERQALQEELDQELIDAVEQAHRDRVDAMVTKWRIKQKLIKAVEELEVCKQRQRAQEREKRAQFAYQEKQHAKRQREQLQFYKFERLFAKDKANGIVVGPVNYGLKETRCQLGDYKIGKVMGTGFYSQVHIGTHFETRQKYAIKRLPKKNITVALQLERVRSEIGVLRKAIHPNIVTLHEVIHAPRTVCLVMELGVQDLQQFCERHMHDYGDMPLKEIALGILEPLVYLHSNGIAHLDLKPENIILSKKLFHASDLTRHDIKLCDFGLCAESSRNEDNEVVTNNVYVDGFWGGTPGFFAPEMVLRPKDTPCEGRIADMWSFGCTMVEMSPEGFPGRRWIESYKLYKSHSNGFKQGLMDSLDVMLDKDYFADKSFGNLMAGLLCLNPEDRMDSSDIMCHHFLSEDAKKSENIGATDIVPVPRTRVVSVSPKKGAETL